MLPMMALFAIFGIFGYLFALVYARYEGLGDMEIEYSYFRT